MPPSCPFTSPNLPSEWETHLRLLAHPEEVAHGVDGGDRARGGRGWLARRIMGGAKKKRGFGVI